MKSVKQHLPFALLGLWTGSLIFTFCLTGSEKTRAAVQQSQNQMILAGGKIFNPTCSSGYCHGNEGFGGSAPTLRGKRYTTEYLTKVISDGVSGTPMPPFKNNYSKKEIEQLVAYVMWISKTEPNKPLPKLSGNDKGKTETAKQPEKSEPAKSEAVKSTVETVADANQLRGDAANGKFLFFDAANERSCRACHLFQGRGGKLGPDLTNIGSKTPRELYLSVTEPHTQITQGYESITIFTKSGERITGIKREENADAIKLFDTATVPPVLRNILKAEVAKVESQTGTPMPGDFAKRYTQKQLLDLITFLKSTNQTAFTVTLKDIQ
ncbi:MAG: c-type cytochrome [Acidobacteriota bacterium]